VFNVLFTLSGGPGQERKYFVHCMNCALSISSSLAKVIVLRQYDMADLEDVYNSLQPWIRRQFTTLFDTTTILPSVTANRISGIILWLHFYWQLLFAFLTTKMPHFILFCASAILRRRVFAIMTQQRPVCLAEYGKQLTLVEGIFTVLFVTVLIHFCGC